MLRLDLKIKVSWDCVRFNRTRWNCISLGIDILCTLLFQNWNKNNQNSFNRMRCVLKDDPCHCIGISGNVVTNDLFIWRMPQDDADHAMCISFHIRQRCRESALVKAVALSSRHLLLSFLFSLPFSPCIILRRIGGGGGGGGAKESYPATATLTVFERTQWYEEYTCNLSEITGFKSPSLESLALASTAAEEEFCLNDLAVYFNLTNSCERWSDVSKANIQVYKVALVTLANETASPLEDLAMSAQNTGYSVLICFGDIVHRPTYAAADEDKLVIPVVTANLKWEYEQDVTGKQVFSSFTYPLLVADRANVEIRVHKQPSTAQELKQMGFYLSRLSYWFLVGPAITLVWLMCKVFWISDGQQGVTVRSETRTMELGRNEELHSDVEATVGNHHGRDEEEQPLLITQNSTVFASSHSRFVRMRRGSSRIPLFGCRGFNVSVFLFVGHYGTSPCRYIYWRIVLV